MNRQLKKSLSISLTAITAISLQSCMIPTVNAASSEDYSYDEFYFDEKPYWLISAYNGTDEDIVLPETKDGIKILGIAEEAFKDNKVIHSVTLPESYSYMGMSAFENSSVTSVNITDNMYSIPLWAFAGCQNLTDVKFNDHIMSIDYQAFKDSSYVLPKELESKVRDKYAGILSNTYSSLEVADGIWEAFFQPAEKNIMLTEYFGEDDEVVFPDTFKGFPVNIIRMSQFPYHITSITVPESIPNVKNLGIKNLNELKSVTVKGDGKNIKLIIENEVLEELSIPRLDYKKNDRDSSFISASACKKLKKVTFTGDYDTLELFNNQFKNCPSLKELVFPKNCNKITIGNETFSECGFETLDIPYDCVLNNYSFQKNKDLTSVIFDGKAEIEGMAFRYCDALKNVTFKNGGNVKNLAFADLPTIENIDISDGLTFSPRAFNNCLNLMTINSEPAFDSKTGDFNSKYKEFILKNFNGAQDVGFINEYVKASVNRIVSEVTSTEMTDVQKAKALHDWLCANTDYDMDNINADNNHNDASVLMNEKTVCEGYASMYDLLLREAGIESYYVHSSDHAWNIINIDGHFFHSDTTWDDHYSTQKWFLRSDAEMKAEGGSHGSWSLLVPSSLHTYARETSPECDHSIGDTNTDGELNVADLVNMSAYLHGKNSPDNGNAVFYDMDFDSDITALDMVQMRKRIL